MKDNQIEIRIPANLNAIKTEFMFGLNLREFIGMLITVCICVFLYLLIPNELNIKIDIIAIIGVTGLIISFFKFQESTLENLFFSFVITNLFNKKVYISDNIFTNIGDEINFERKKEIKEEIKKERKERKLFNKKLKKLKKDFQQQ